jgi:hypothetical protein
LAVTVALSTLALSATADGTEITAERTTLPRNVEAEKGLIFTLPAERAPERGLKITLSNQMITRQ